MNTTKKKKRKQPSQEEIDRIVESQADDNAAWEKPIQVRRERTTSVTIPGELAARAAFLSRLHKEKNVEEWLRKVIKERVEIEEVAFSEAKREMKLRNGV